MVRHGLGAQATCSQGMPDPLRKLSPPPPPSPLTLDAAVSLLLAFTLSLAITTPLRSS